MKILMLCRLYSPHLGGVEKHIEELSRELIGRGHEIEVITEKHESSLADKEIVSGVLVYRIPKQSLSSKFNLWSWIIKNREIFKNTDIVHVHDVFWWYFPLRLLYWNKPVYITFHGYERVEGPTIGAVVIRKLSELLSKRSICIGDWMRSWYHHSPTFVSYGASDSKPSLLPKQTNAVFIGRLESDTGILEYVRAIKELGGSVSLDIFGDGELREKISQEIKRHKYIRLLGVTKTPGSQLAKYRYVFSSQYLTMLEAHQIGRQVVAYAASPLKRDYLNSFPTHKQIVVSQSVESLVTGLRSLLNNSALEKENIRKAKVWAKKQTWKKLAEEYEKLWHK